MAVPTPSPPAAGQGVGRSGARLPWRATALGLVTVGGIVAIAGMFGPWVYSGAATRSSFELADLVERLGFARRGLVGRGIRSWPMAPLLVVAGMVPMWWFGGRIAAALSIAAGVMVGLVGAAVWTAPDSRLFGSEWGSLVTAIGAGALAAGGVVEVVGRSTGSRRAPSAVAAGSLVPDTPTFEDRS